MTFYRVDDSIAAVREGAEVIGWVNEKTGIGVGDVLTDDTLVYNLRANEDVMITHLVYSLTTLSDSMHVELGYTDQPDGAGLFYPLTAHYHLATGGAIAGFTDQHRAFNLPRRVSYRLGARSITCRVTANDVDAEITLEWGGWIEHT
jgi:hypothetical protein